jgi:hypothetical protein
MGSGLALHHIMLGDFPVGDLAGVLGFVHLRILVGFIHRANQRARVRTETCANGDARRANDRNGRSAYRRANGRAGACAGSCALARIAGAGGGPLIASDREDIVLTIGIDVEMGDAVSGKTCSLQGHQGTLGLVLTFKSSSYDDAHTLRLRWVSSRRVDPGSLQKIPPGRAGSGRADGARGRVWRRGQQRRLWAAGTMEVGRCPLPETTPEMNMPIYHLRCIDQSRRLCEEDVRVRLDIVGLDDQQLEAIEQGRAIRLTRRQIDASHMELDAEQRAFLGEHGYIEHRVDIDSICEACGEID